MIRHQWIAELVNHSMAKHCLISLPYSRLQNTCFWIHTWIKTDFRRKFWDTPDGETVGAVVVVTRIQTTATIEVQVTSVIMSWGIRGRRPIVAVRRHISKRTTIVGTIPRSREKHSKNSNRWYKSPVPNPSPKERKERRICNCKLMTLHYVGPLVDCWTYISLCGKVIFNNLATLPIVKSCCLYSFLRITLLFMLQALRHTGRRNHTSGCCCSEGSPRLSWSSSCLRCLSHYR